MLSVPNRAFRLTAIRWRGSRRHNQRSHRTVNTVCRFWLNDPCIVRLACCRGDRASIGSWSVIRRTHGQWRLPDLGRIQHGSDTRDTLCGKHAWINSSCTLPGLLVHADWPEVELGDGPCRNSNGRRLPHSRVLALEAAHRYRYACGRMRWVLHANRMIVTLACK